MNKDAVACHAVLSSYDPGAESESIPCHAELAPILAELPEALPGCVWRVIDPESGTGSYSHEDLGIAELPTTEVTWDDDRGYGGCRQVTRGGRVVGLNVWVNGCSGASALSYLVISVPQPFAALLDFFGEHFPDAEPSAAAYGRHLWPLAPGVYEIAELPPPGLVRCERDDVLVVNYDSPQQAALVRFSGPAELRDKYPRATCAEIPMRSVSRRGTENRDRTVYLVRKEG